MNNTTKFEAGVWEQGEGFVAWSSHSTAELAQRAAKKYAKSQKQATGGALSWAGGYRMAGSDSVTWIAK